MNVVTPAITSVLTFVLFSFNLKNFSKSSEVIEYKSSLIKIPKTLQYLINSSEELLTMIF